MTAGKPPGFGIKSTLSWAAFLTSDGRKYQYLDRLFYGIGQAVGIFIVNHAIILPMSSNAKNRAAPWSSVYPVQSSRAFTLVELLTVIAVIGLMMAAVVPAFNGIKGAGDITKAAYDISGTLEQARAYAMANNTYVFVGFAEQDGVDATQPGIGQILVMAMGSNDGTRSFGGTGTPNLTALTKLRRIGNMHMEDTLPNSGALTRPVVPDSCRVGNGAFLARDSFVSSGYQFKKIIQFDPRGMASIQSDTASVSQWMEIGLVAAKGHTAADAQNCAALVLDGVTGSAKIYRQ